MKCEASYLNERQTEGNSKGKYSGKNIDLMGNFIHQEAFQIRHVRHFHLNVNISKWHIRDVLSEWKCCWKQDKILKVDSKYTFRLQRWNVPQ